MVTGLIVLALSLLAAYGGSGLFLGGFMKGAISLGGEGGTMIVSGIILSVVGVVGFIWSIIHLIVTVINSLN